MAEAILVALMVTGPTLLFFAMPRLVRWVRVRRWLFALAVDRNVPVRWWWSNERMRADLIRSFSGLPWSANKRGLELAIYELSCCLVDVKTKAPGSILVVPKRHRDWQRVWRAVREHRDSLVGLCEEISVAIPKRGWID